MEKAEITIKSKQHYLYLTNCDRHEFILCVTPHSVLHYAKEWCNGIALEISMFNKRSENANKFVLIYDVVCV